MHPARYVCNSKKSFLASWTQAHAARPVTGAPLASRLTLGAYLAFAFSGLSVLLTIVLTLVIQRTAVEGVAGSIGANLAELASQTASRLDRGMFERYREVQLMSVRLGRLDDPARLCAELGHHVEEADPQVDGDALVPTFLTLIAANTVVNVEGHHAGKTPRAEEFERVTWAMYERGQRITGPEYVRGATHEATPDVPSVAVNETESAWLYQPFASAPRAGVAVTDGPVASYAKPNAVELLTFPATSVQLPDTAADPVSGPEYVTCVQPAIPDVASPPENETVSAWLYQPFESAPRAGVAATPVGALASYCNGNDAEPTFPALSVQEPVTAALPSSGPE